MPLISAVPFSPEVVQHLARQPDRSAYNLPDQLLDIKIVRSWDAFLPVYLIETADETLIAYSAAGSPRDSLIEHICQQTPQIQEMIINFPRGNPQEIWTNWLARAKHGPGILGRQPNGLWRATFRADAFGPRGTLRIHQLGSFHFHSKNFVQLWCDDKELRRSVFLDRLLRVVQLPNVTTEADLLGYTAHFSDLLEVPTVDLPELRRYAEREGNRESLTRLDALR